MERPFSWSFYFLLIVVMALLALVILVLSSALFQGPLAARILFSGIEVFAILMFFVFASAAKEMKAEASGKPLSGTMSAEHTSNQVSFHTQQGISFSKSRWYWRAAAATGFLLIVTGFCLIELHVDMITPENCDRIQIGMTMAEVEAILGASPGNCSKRFWKIQPPTYLGNKIGEREHRKGQEYFWMGDKGTIAVVFDQNGKVKQKSFKEAPAESYSNVIRQIFRWLARSSIEL